MRHILLLAFAAVLAAADGVQPGELILERPTLRSLGCEWRFTGDDNGNAQVAVRVREAGGAWHASLPLVRVGATGTMPMGKDVQRRMPMPYTTQPAFLGSMLDLRPGTAYEIELTLADPDGVTGEAQRTFTQSTRAEPGPAAAEAPRRHVYPPGHKGPREEPAYDSIMHAVNGFNPIWDNYQTIHPGAAKPGTVILLHAGTYAVDRFHYREGTTQMWLCGTYLLIANGTAEAPIRIQAAGDGEVVIDGRGCATLFDVRSADYLHFEGLTIRDCDIAFDAGRQGVRGGGARGLTVRDCWIEGVVYGVLAQDGRSQDFTITNNVILGRNPFNRFNPESGGAYGRTRAGYAVNISGSGHAICHNFVSNFWDSINVFTNALADPALGQQARAIDIHDNIIRNSTDDFIETDGGYANIRVQRNLCVGNMGFVLSTQPNYAGPTYVLRNVFWQLGNPSAIKPDGKAPNLVYCHNTVSAHLLPPVLAGTIEIRNNAFLGPAAPLKDSRTMARLPGGGVRSDHNAYRRIAEGGVFQVGKGSWPDLAAMQVASGLEAHSLLIEALAGVIVGPEPAAVQNNAVAIADLRSVDVSPCPGSPLIDAGVHIPGLNDGFQGRAPDIGAIESGAPPPTWGPRTTTWRQRLDDLLAGTYKPLGTP
jgi:hypothetical protein